MPGLFDNIGGGGLFSSLGNAFGNIAAGMENPAALQQLRQQQQGQQATYQSLLNSGAPEHIARAAALNPREFGQFAAPYLDTAPKLLETGTDTLTGQKSFAQQRFQGGNISLSPIGTAGPGGVFPANGAAGGASEPQSMEAFKRAAESGVAGEDLYKFLPEGARQTVRSIVEQRTNLSPFAMGKPQMRPFIDAANIIDPSLNMLEPAARAKAMADAKTGQIGQSQRGINQAIYHIADKLVPAMKATGNGSIPALNMVKNLANQATGGTNTTAFYPAAIAVADEMSRAFKGSHMSDSQINAWKESLSPNMSPAQQKVAVQTLLGLLEGAAHAAGEQRRQGIGDVAHAKMGPMVTADTQKKLSQIQEFIGGGEQPATSAAAPGVSEGMTATNPKTGQKIMFKGGQWVPAQ